MITMAQARELAHLINAYTDATVKVRECEISPGDYDAAKRAMSSFISRMVDSVEAAAHAMSLPPKPAPVDDEAEKKRQRKNFLARQRRAHKK